MNIKTILDYVKDLNTIEMNLNILGQLKAIVENSIKIDTSLSIRSFELFDV